MKIEFEQIQKISDSLDKTDKIIKSEDLDKKPKVQKRKAEESIWEVDLHVHEITDETDFMSPAQLLQIQKDFFEEKLKLAILKKIRKVIFIHGRGKGKLKNEIRAVLKRYPNCEFSDGNYQKYGQGATEVIIWNQQ